jgi:hypothetical protein
MKKLRTIKDSPASTAPVWLATLAGRILTGAVALLLIAAAFGGRAWAITGGQLDGTAHPNVGTVLVFDPDYGRIIPSGSGTLIGERVFLTAGHVVEPIHSGHDTLLAVSFDPIVDLNGADWQDDTTWPTTWRRVESYKYSYVRGDAHALRPLDDELQHHPRTANPNEEDIAVLILDEPVTNIAPATLPAPGLLDYLKKSGQLDAPKPGGTLFTVVGYGRGLDFPPPRFIPAVSPDGYAHRNVAETGYVGLNDAWLITLQNPAAGYGGTGEGDSGGPTFWHDPATGKDVLVSITSWGGSYVGTGFSYRIDTEKSLQFIQSVIDGLPPE